MTQPVAISDQLIARGLGALTLIGVLVAAYLAFNYTSSDSSHSEIEAIETAVNAVVANDNDFSEVSNTTVVASNLLPKNMTSGGSTVIKGKRGNYTVAVSASSNYQWTNTTPPMSSADCNDEVGFLLKQKANVTQVVAGSTTLTQAAQPSTTAIQTACSSPQTSLVISYAAFQQ